MENVKSDKEKMFDSFLTKTIILSSRTYFKKYMNTITKENTIFDNENYSAFLQGFMELNSSFSAIDKIDMSIELNSAIKSLSAIEQAVIFLLFNEQLSQDEAAEILAIWSKSISRIKIRAIEKLRKYLKGDFDYEK